VIIENKIQLEDVKMFGYFLLVYLWFLVTLSDFAWVRVWEDNFDWNGEVDLNKWEFDVGGHGRGNNEEEYYTYNRPENARCELFPNSANGRLIIEARKVSMRKK
jgi:hypothetical protein